MHSAHVGREDAPGRRRRAQDEDGPALTDEELKELMALVREADSVELKLTIPGTARANG